MKVLGIASFVPATNISINNHTPHVESVESKTLDDLAVAHFYPESHVKISRSFVEADRDSLEDVVPEVTEEYPCFEARPDTLPSLAHTR